MRTSLGAMHPSILRTSDPPAAKQFHTARVLGRKRESFLRLCTPVGDDDLLVILLFAFPINLPSETTSYVRPWSGKIPIFPWNKNLVLQSRGTPASHRPRSAGYYYCRRRRPLSHPFAMPGCFLPPMKSVFWRRDQRMESPKSDWSLGPAKCRRSSFWESSKRRLEI